MNLDKYNNIHFVGIGGIGISAIARLMLKMGKRVTGSDVVDSPITDDLKQKGAKIIIGHRTENISDKLDLVVYSAAVPQDNPELKTSYDKHLAVYSYPEILGLLMEGQYGIAIAGTNGKTTVTAMIGLILEKTGFDPTVVVGSNIKKFEGNARLGSSLYWVAEACEYRAHMLKINPRVIVLTNIEEDHLDFYKDLKDIINHFQKFINKLPNKGILVFNNDDANIKQLIKPDCPIVSYGLKNESDLMASEIKTVQHRQEFDLVWHKKRLGRFSLSLPSMFNVYNTLAASAICLSLGVSEGVIRDFLNDFDGFWRRFEKIGEFNGAPVISDYAHLPTSIRETIKGTRQFFPKKRIFVVFQPHQHARTKKLFKDFAKSFKQADFLILNEIYRVEGREETQYQDVSSKDLLDEIKKSGLAAVYAKDLSATEELIRQNLKDNDVLLIMGAGDIYKVGERLIKK